MNIFLSVHDQFKGFSKAGKKLIPPKNKAELQISRTISFLLLLFTIFFFRFIFTVSFLPLRIYIRAFLILIPLIAFIIKFYRGISISWILRGLKKYWLVSFLMIYAYIAIAYLFYHILAGVEFRLNQLYFVAGSLVFLIGFCFSSHFWVQAWLLSRSEHKDTWQNFKILSYIVIGIFFGLFLLGGLFYLADSLGFIDLGS